MLYWQGESTSSVDSARTPFQRIIKNSGRSSCILRTGNGHNNSNLVALALSKTTPKKDKDKMKNNEKLNVADLTSGQKKTFTRNLDSGTYQVTSSDLRYHKDSSSDPLHSDVLPPGEMANKANYFDAVLVDPPYNSTSGGHNLQNCDWEKAASFIQMHFRYGIDCRLSETQILGLYLKLMSSALLLTKVGGRILVKCQASEDFPLDALVIELARKVGNLRYLKKFLLETNVSSNTNAENFSTLIVFQKTGANSTLVVNDLIAAGGNAQGEQPQGDGAACKELERLSENKFQVRYVCVRFVPSHCLVLFFCVRFIN